jgi:hypothetical protein
MAVCDYDDHADHACITSKSKCDPRARLDGRGHGPVRYFSPSGNLTFGASCRIMLADAKA